MKSIQKILGHLRRADEKFRLIANGDRICVGVSGGKDSLLLLQCLVAYQKFGLKNFQIVAATVDCTGGALDYSQVAAFCDKQGVKYIIEPSNIFEIIFDIRKEKNPCSLCSKLRGGMLNGVALREGCNKVALAHHGDDLIETFCLSLFYEGRISTFLPKSFLDKTGLTLIRPFVYVTEREIMPFVQQLPVVSNPCPANHNTQREYMKKLVEKFESDMPGARERMLAAITREMLKGEESFDNENKKPHN